MSFNVRLPITSSPSFSSIVASSVKANISCFVYSNSTLFVALSVITNFPSSSNASNTKSLLIDVVL